MTTREIILQTLRSTDDFVSGELLSQQCEISRWFTSRNAK